MASFISNEKINHLFVESIFQNHPDGVFVLDEKGEFIRFNDTWVKLIGYTPDELSQFSVFEILQPQSLWNTIDDLKQFIQNKLARAELQLSIKKAPLSNWKQP